MTQSLHPLFTAKAQPSFLGTLVNNSRLKLPRRDSTMELNVQLSIAEVFKLGEMEVGNNEHDGHSASPHKC